VGLLCTVIRVIRVMYRVPFVRLEAAEIGHALVHRVEVIHFDSVVVGTAKMNISQEFIKPRSPCDASKQSDIEQQILAIVIKGE
jgi:hypothetical protein